MYDTRERQRENRVGSLTLWFPGRITCRGRKENEDWLAYKYSSSKVEFWAGMGVIYVCMCVKERL